MIQIKSHFTDWHEVSEVQALRFAAVLFNGMVCRNKLVKVHERIRGITFDEEELRNEIGSIGR